MTRQSKILPFESLRGLAACIVALLHFQILQNSLTTSSVVRNGDLAVDFFFVLSGFVIFHQFKDSQFSKNSIYGLVKIRFYRLFPLHLFVLILYLVFEALKFTVNKYIPGYTLSPSFFSDLDFIVLFSHLTLTQIFFDNIPFLNIPSWSVAVEFYMYLAIIVLTAVVPLIYASFIFLFISTVVLILLESNSFLDPTAPGLFFRGLYGFSIGILSSRISLRFETVKSPGPLSLFCFFLIFFTMVALGKSDFEFFSSFVFGFSLFFLSRTDENSLSYKIITFRPLVWLGSISYSVYLLHSIVWVFIGNVLRFFMPESFVVENGLRFLKIDSDYLSIGVTILSLFFVLVVSVFAHVNIEERFRSAR